MLGGVEVVPFCMYPRKTAQEEVEAIANTVANFLAVNLEDIKAPECFDIEEGLKDKKLLPVFHDDQHGTAIVVLAALINAIKVSEKKIEEVRVVINGAGAAGVTIAKLLLSYGAKDIIVCDTKGAIYKERKEGMNQTKK
jgi:malate dehydrogenase (oxaloacetate-decarboxylating)